MVRDREENIECRKVFSSGKKMSQSERWCVEFDEKINAKEMWEIGESIKTGKSANKGEAIERLYYIYYIK